MEGIDQRLVGDEYQTRLTFVAAVVAAAVALHSATISLTGPLIDDSPGPCSARVFLTFSFLHSSNKQHVYTVNHKKVAVHL